MLHPSPVAPAIIVSTEPVTVPFSGCIRTDVDGYKTLASFQKQVAGLRDQTIRLNWQQLAHFDANLSAIFLALVERLSRDNNLKFQLDSQSISNKHEIFARNGLASAIMGTPYVEDTRRSTIPVRRFTIDEIDDFSQYIQNDMFCHPRLDSLALDTKQRIGSYFSELFCNVEIHAGTDEVFVCGQFFPGISELRFTMVDLGCGFLRKISDYTSGSITNAYEAIKWALTGNTTKTQAAGGSGLRNIITHCASTSDSVHIVTDNCYLQFDPLKSKKVVYSMLDRDCSGTTIHMIFRGL